MRMIENRRPVRIPAKAVDLKHREFQALADTLCQMAVSSRLDSDLEQLCQLPDGRLSIDLVRNSSSHSVSGPLSLRIVADLHTWIAQRLLVSDEHLIAAQIEIVYRTDAVPTDHNRIVMFDLESNSTIGTEMHSWRGKSQKGALWHRRPGV